MMPKRRIQDRFTTKLREETFLHIIDNSKMGITIIQRDNVKYVNQKFIEIFGYTKKEILEWKKRECYKIIHPEDLTSLFSNFNLEPGKKMASVRFRAITKNKEVINIEANVCPISYNDAIAYLSTYYPLGEDYRNASTSKLKKIVELKKIMVDFHPKIIKLLEDNDIPYNIYNLCSYKEEL
jgi:PAS domain S-box-containing protein